MRNKVIGISKDVEMLSYLASVGVTDADFADISAHDISLQECAKRFKVIQEGVTTIPIIRPLRKEDIISLADLPVLPLTEEITYSKFTPSSGAASRMFQSLAETLKSIRETGTIPVKHEKSIAAFILGLSITSDHQFAFLSELASVLSEKEGAELVDLIEKINSGDVSKIESIKTILEFVLEDKGLNYSNKPKALIAFHTNEYGKPVTALEEQMVDAVMYGQSKLHLTVSEEHMSWYEQEVEKIKQEQNALADVEITYSFQAKGSDSPALGEDGKVFRDNKGKIKFFPAGHGSLVDNLKNTPIALIRNIDNVPNPQASKDEVYSAHLKMVGALVFFQVKLKTLLDNLISETISGEDAQKELLQMVKDYKLNLFMDFDKFAMHRR